jgi:hypothetical protein
MGRAGQRGIGLCWAIAVLVGLAGAARAAAELVAPAPLPGCADPAAADTVASITDEGEFVLASGLRLRLADLRPLLAGAAVSKLQGWMAGLVSQRVAVAAGPPDRWGVAQGRLGLRVGAADRQIDVAELLVGEGFAVVDAGEQDALCQPALLRLEAAARAEGRGLWRESDLVVAADDTAALARHVGHFAIAEGRVVSVGERAQRTYLNLGRFGSGALTLTLPKRSWAVLRARGVTGETLRGKRVRARGLVEMWRAPVMEIVAPDMLEVLPPAGETR